MKMKSVFFSCLLLSVAVPVTAQQATDSESSLTIYVYPPRHRLNWKSPKTLLKSFATSGIERGLTDDGAVDFESDFGEEGKISSNYKSTMGHTIGHAACTLSSGEKYERWSSFSGQDFREVDKRIAVKEKLGLGTLFYDFPDGHIVSGSENLNRLIFYNGSAPLYIQYKIDGPSCDRLKAMIDFFESFHFAAGTPLQELESRNPEDLLYFTTNMDPYDSYQQRLQTGRGKVGGGCAPYGVSMIKAIGHFHPIFSTAWMYHQPVSEKLIGGLKDENTGEIRRVPFQKILLSDLGSQWVHEGYQNRMMSQYDPQMIWDFVGEVQKCLQGKACSENASVWLQSEANVAAGPVITYQGSVEKTRRRQGRTERYQKKAVQNIQGIRVGL